MCSSTYQSLACHGPIYTALLYAALPLYGASFRGSSLHAVSVVAHVECCTVYCHVAHVTALLRHVESGGRLKMAAGVPAVIRDLVCELWAVDAQARPAFGGPAGVLHRIRAITH